MTSPVLAKRRHPAPYPRYVFDLLVLVLSRERRRVGRQLRVLDPMAGVGRIHDLPSRIGTTVGVEIEPEWAAQRSGTLVGDATQLPSNWQESFDAVTVSPCYGNRMADKHEAKDSCAACQGVGVKWTEHGCADAPMLCSDCHSIACSCGGIGKTMRNHAYVCESCRPLRCSSCDGSGFSKRYTYRHALGRMPTEGSAGVMQWGDSYRDLHERAWVEARRVLRPEGLLIVNCKNHIRMNVEQLVVEWHALTIKRLGFELLGVLDVNAKGMLNGANRGQRIDKESLIVARRES